MADSNNGPLDASLAQLPVWAQEMASKYLSGSSSLFVLSGNVNDWVPLQAGGTRRFVSLTEFLSTAMFGTRKTTLQYDQGSGIVVNKESATEFFKTVQALDTVGGTSYAQKLPRAPTEALFLIDRYIRSRLLEGHGKVSIALLINFAHMVVPRSEPQFMNQDEFRTLITLLKWASDPDFVKSDITIVLITGSLPDLHESIINNPFTSKIQIDPPTEAERLDYIRSTSLPVAYEGVTPETLAKQTNALSRVDIEVILRESLRGGKLDMAFVSRKKKELIEKSCFGLLEFLEPRATLDDVQGLEAAKKRLRDDIQLIKKGYWDALPMGYLICGPVGTGKTYISTCAIGELGIPCVQLLNFRSKWVGTTEGNLEKILMTLRALGPVGVIIDEADAFMGTREADGDSGTSGRIFAQFATQMGDTKYRGKIIWFLLTSRPDLLPIDIKRQGRVEVHIPLFYPHELPEKIGMFVAMSKKQKWPLETSDVDGSWIAGKSLSGADVESIVVSAKRKSLLDNNTKPKKSYLEEAINGFISSTSVVAVKHQELAAVIECNDRSFLPPDYLKADRTELLKEFNQLRLVLGAGK